MKRLTVAGLAALALMTTPAIAGNAGMKDAAGNKLRIACKSGGCTVQSRPKATRSN